MADAGTVVPTYTTAGSVKVYKWAWTSHASNGNVELAVARGIDGALMSLCTDPGATAPTDNYDVTIEDPDGIDILNSKGLDRDTTATEWAGVVADAIPRHVNIPNFTLKVDNAGNSKVGTIYLSVR